jgi:hypothetical protein
MLNLWHESTLFCSAVQSHNSICEVNMVVIRACFECQNSRIFVKVLLLKLQSRLISSSDYDMTSKILQTMGLTAPPW